MNPPDMEEFAALWRDEPDLAEQAQMEAYARAARRRGRLIDYLDYAMVFAVAIMMVAGSFVSTNPLTIAVAVPLMIATTWMTYQRRRLRQMARTLNTSGRIAFFESSLRNARANLRRNTIGLVSVPFVVPAALFFKVSIRTGGGPEEVWEAFLLWTQTVRAPLTIVALLIIALFALRSRRKIKSEMKRLEFLRERYEAEATREI
jgi:TRAP-type C4-dicarboxylate transport system permease large subunit